MEKNIAKQIKALRKNKGLTQSELGKFLQVGQTTIANYENSKRIPDVEMISKIANFFEVSIDSLIGRQDSINNDLDYKFNDYFNAIIKGNVSRASEICDFLLSNGMSIREFYGDYITKALYEVGSLWEKGVISVWQEHLATESSISVINNISSKYLVDKPLDNKLLAVTPIAETHNIGLRIISSHLKLQGWDTLFLGSNIPTASIINAIEIIKPNAIILSVTMPYLIDTVATLIKSIRDANPSNCPIIFLGGLAFENQEDESETYGADYLTNDIEDVIKILS